MFVPVPREFHRSDDDCAAVSWQRGRKVLTVMLNCYGSPPTVRGGLCEPPGGTYSFPSFDDGWKWYCQDEEVLPSGIVTVEELARLLDTKPSLVRVALEGYTINISKRQ